MCALCKRYGTAVITDPTKLSMALEDAGYQLSNLEIEQSHTLWFIDSVTMKEPAFDAERDGEWEVAHRGR